MGCAADKYRFNDYEGAPKRRPSPRVGTLTRRIEAEVQAPSPRGRSRLGSSDCRRIQPGRFRLLDQVRRLAAICGDGV